MVLDNLQSVRYFYPELILIAAIMLVILSDITFRRLRNILNPLLTLASLL